jgi:thiamine biosynthesis protein ThiI
MDRVIVIRYGEIFLKGKNRGFFEKLLITNIEKKIKKFDCALKRNRGRYEISSYNLSVETEIIDELKTVFGIKSISIAQKIKSDVNVMTDIILKDIPKNVTFRINTHRADKTFPLTSPQVSAVIGEKILDSDGSLTVDLHNPDIEIQIDIREDGYTYIFKDKIECAGGMPVGSAGKGLLLLSGGIDSPVSGYMMAKRGLSLDAIHFYSYPYTSIQSKEKVVELAKIAAKYCGAMNLVIVPFTKIQEAIHEKCCSDYMITIVRRFMMRIAERVAIFRDCGCLVNGESLGQVASQTLQSINVTNSVIERLPVFRPVIGMDKQEIIDISRKIGTYDISVLPYEDCCTVFMPDSPVTKPSIHRAEAEETKIENMNSLIEEVLDNLEIIKIEI